MLESDALGVSGIIPTYLTQTSDTNQTSRLTTGNNVATSDDDTDAEEKPPMIGPHNQAMNSAAYAAFIVFRGTVRPLISHAKYTHGKNPAAQHAAPTQVRRATSSP